MFPEEDLTADDFVRIDGDVGYFRTPDGSRIAVDLRQSPYARRAAAEAIVRRSGGEPRMGAGAQATTMAAPPPAAPPSPPVAAPASTQAESSASAMPFYADAPAQADWLRRAQASTQPLAPTQPAAPTAPAQPLAPPPPAQPARPQTSREWLRERMLSGIQRRDEQIRQQYAFAQQMPAFQQGGPAAPTAPTAPPALAPQPAPVQPAPVAPATVQAPAMPLRVRTEGPSLDQLMVPGGADLGGTLADIVGSTPQQRREDARYGLIDRAADLEARRADVAGAAAEQQAQALGGATESIQQIERDRRQAMAQARGNYERAIDSLGAMHEDPARILRSAGGGISAAIAIGLGAAGASLMGGGENTALAIIQRNIDRDIAAQRTDINTAGTVAEGRRNLVSMMEREFQSRSAAEAAARSVMLQAAEAQTARMTAGLDNEAARLRGEQLRQQLSDQSAAAAAQAQQQEAEWNMNMRLQGARLQRMELRNAQTAQQMQARAGAGARGRAPTEAQMRAFNTYVESGANPMEAARIMRIAPELVPQSGRFALGVPAEQRVELTPARMETVNRMLSSGASRAEVAQATGLPESMIRQYAPAQDTEQAGTIIELESALREVEGLLGESGTNAPGIGTIESALPNAMISQRGRDLRASIANVIDLLGRDRSGAGLTQDDQASFRAILGSAGTEEDLRSGIQRIYAGIRARVSQFATGRTLAQEEAARAAAAPGFVGRRSE